MQARPTFLDYLRQMQAKGTTHLYLDDSARTALRELYKKVHVITKKRRAETTGAASAAPATKRTTPAAESAQPPIVARVTRPSSGSPAEKIAALAAQAAHWRPAQQLGTLRKHSVFSSGSPIADIAMIDAAPSFQDERDSRPLAGEAGAKLDGVLKAMGLSREEIYLTLALKFRPAMDNQSTANRKATAAEMATCLPFLAEELAIVQPKCLVALGPTVARTLLQTDAPFSELRGRWHDYHGTPLRVTWHPSYLLHRADSREDKRAVWEDMLAVMERLAMPISDKQRGYFAPRV